MRLPADQRRLQLLEVALVRFAEGGFHATSMDEIAESAGVTKPVLYQHFPSKRALYIELLENAGSRMLTTLADSIVAAGTPRERVEAGFAAYFRFVAEEGASFQLLRDSSMRSDDDFATIFEEIINAVTETLATLIDMPDEQQRVVLASAIVGVSESVSRRVLRKDVAALSPEQLAAWCAEMAWFGLRGVRTNRGPFEGVDRRRS